jgi:hemoglobin
LGGPNLFMEEFGHPMLRARHFLFSIGESERDQWMLCMNKALENALQDLATQMINKGNS